MVRLLIVAHQRELLTSPLHVLDGMTPLEAAASPGERKRLEQWVKEHIHHSLSDARKNGYEIDLNPLLKPLNMEHLI